MQQYGERIENLSQQDKLIKICMDAGFVNVVENGQYFMTKDTADLSRFHAVACREYTLPREEPASQPKGWIQGNTKIGPVLEVTTRYLNPEFPQQQLKNYHARKICVFLRGPVTWKVTPRNVWNDIVSWQTRKWSSFTMFQVLAWMIIISMKEELKSVGHCHMYALKLF